MHWYKQIYLKQSDVFHVSKDTCDMPKYKHVLKVLILIIVFSIICSMFGLNWKSQSIYRTEVYSNSVTTGENDENGQENVHTTYKIHEDNHISGLYREGETQETVYTYDNDEDLMKLRVPKYDERFKNPCWYEKVNTFTTLRCLPYFFLIGVKKSGTTTLFSMISGHPDFANPNFKEAQWFPRRRFEKYNRRFNDYINMFKEAAKKIALKQNHRSGDTQKKNAMVTGEGTPANLHLNSHWRHLPGNEGLKEPKYVILDYIHHFLPSAKMIIVFRDPVERLYSDYYHEYGRLAHYPGTNKYHFHSVVEEGLALYKDCFEHFTIRSCVYNESLYEHTKIQIQLGIYYVYWEELTRLYPRNQIKVVHNGNMNKNLKLSVQNTLRFLGMSTLNDSTYKRIHDHVKLNSRQSEYDSQGDMLQITRDLLEDFYRPFNYNMYNITDDKQFLYTYS